MKQVQSFLGLANYYHCFIDGFAKIAVPLMDLLKKEKRWKWTLTQQNTFDKLKRRITSAPILQAPDMKLPFIVTTDASDTAVGEVLSQMK